MDHWKSTFERTRFCQAFQQRRVPFVSRQPVEALQNWKANSLPQVSYRRGNLNTDWTELRRVGQPRVAIQSLENDPALEQEPEIRTK